MRGTGKGGIRLSRLCAAGSIGSMQRTSGCAGRRVNVAIHAPLRSAISARGFCIDPEIQQSLLRAVAPDGSVIELVTLTDGRCALLRDNQALELLSGDADGVDRAVREFLRLTHLRRK
jgi:hypothetical protein